MTEKFRLYPKSSLLKKLKVRLKGFYGATILAIKGHLRDTTAIMAVVNSHCYGYRNQI